MAVKKVRRWLGEGVDFDQWFPSKPQMQGHTYATRCMRPINMKHLDSDETTCFFYTRSQSHEVTPRLFLTCGEASGYQPSLGIFYVSRSKGSGSFHRVIETGIEKIYRLSYHITSHHITSIQALKYTSKASSYAMMLSIYVAMPIPMLCRCANRMCTVSRVK